MATDVRKHTVPAAGDPPARSDLLDLGLSIRDAIPVANTTARAQLITDLGTAGIGPSTSNPVIVFRADADTGREFEYTVNGSTWRVLPADIVDTVSLTALFQNGTAAQTPESVRQFGWVQLQGGWQMAAGTSPVTPAIAYQTGTVLFQLPSGHRPTRQLVFPSGAYGATAMIAANVRVNTNGNVEVFVNNGGSGSTTGVFPLGAVRFRHA